MKYIDVEVIKYYYGCYTKFKELIEGTVIKLSEDMIKPLLARDIVKIYVKPEAKDIVKEVVDGKQTEKKIKEDKK